MIYINEFIQEDVTMRNLIIDESQLRLLLESKKIYIGGSIASAIGLIAGH